MNAKPYPCRRSAIAVASASALSALIAVGMLSAVMSLFQSRGVPLGQLAAAERSCAEHAYVSERERCVRQWFVHPYSSSVASK